MAKSKLLSGSSVPLTGPINYKEFPQVSIAMSEGQNYRTEGPRMQGQC